MSDIDIGGSVKGSRVVGGHVNAPEGVDVPETGKIKVGVDVEASDVVAGSYWTDDSALVAALASVADDLRNPDESEDSKVALVVRVLKVGWTEAKDLLARYLAYRF